MFALFSVAVAKLLKSAGKSLTKRCQKRAAGGAERAAVREGRERERENARESGGSERVSAAHKSQALLVAVVVRP